GRALPGGGPLRAQPGPGARRAAGGVRGRLLRPRGARRRLRPARREPGGRRGAAPPRAARPGADRLRAGGDEPAAGDHRHQLAAHAHHGHGDGRGGRGAVPGLALRARRPRHPVPGGDRPPVDPVRVGLAGARGRPRLPPAALLHDQHGRLPQLAGRLRGGRGRAAVPRHQRPGHLGRAVLRLHLLRAAAPPPARVAGQPAAGGAVHLVPARAGLHQLGPADDLPVRPGAGLDLRPHPLAQLRRRRAPDLRPGAVRGAAARPPAQLGRRLPGL
ncbi:MAG: Abortive infection protein, partial [uncultured Quadrisphaera sp.]